MITGHKNKAWLGLALWFAPVPLLVLFFVLGKYFILEFDKLADELFPYLFLGSIGLQYFAFFWGGSHLAKAKGYSPTMLYPGIIWPLQILMLGLLWLALPDKTPKKMAAPSSRRHRRSGSPIERNVRYRRNAFIFNGLGLVGILAALALMFLPLGLFQTRSSAYVAAIFVFLPAYASVLYGCWWWVRAKDWPDAVIFIGLCPLAPLLIPYVRILYMMTGVLPLLMVVMPVLMLGVVMVLPDKSGFAQQRRRDASRGWRQMFSKPEQD